MILFYWLVTVMTLDQHWLWGMEIAERFTIIKLLGIVCLLMACFKLGTGKVRAKRLYDSAPARWLIAFLVLLGVGAVHSLPANVSTAYQHLFSIVALWVTVLVLVHSRVSLQRTILCAVASAAIASLYAVRQHATYGSTVDGFRSAGIFSDSNQYALIVGLWVPIAFLWSFSQQPWWERLFCFGSFVVAMLGLFLAASRGGFVGLIAAFLYVIARSRRPFRNLMVVSALSIPLLFWSSSPLLRRLTDPSNGDKQAEDARLVVWKAGLLMIEEHPLIGVGMHNFKSLILAYEEPGQEIVSLAHNSYLEIAAEMGGAVLLVYLGVLGFSFGALERVRRRSRRRGMANLANMAVGLQAGLISYLFSSFFFSAWFEKMLWLLVFVSMALYRNERDSRSSHGRTSNLQEPVTGDALPADMLSV